MHGKGKSYKLAVTLMGSPTLLLTETPLVTKVMSKGNFERRRNELAEELLLEERINLKPGQIFAFTCGEVDSPVHSEPDISTDRIFVSMVPGSRDQIYDLTKIRSVNYSD